MFNKMAIYLTGELTATSEDYKLLENMNKLTSLKYLEMKDIAINISRNLKDLNQKYAGLQPYLEQINLIEDQVAALEQAAYKLDAYSKKLELSLNWGNSRRSNGAFQAAYVTDHYFCYQPSHEKQSTKNWRNDERSTLCNETSRIPDFSYKKSDQISLTC
ncbi:biogenesis of lysosome-related organelles complex 1 subunit 2 isoform X3 [Hemicordylus capensis]|nr:biogenesis of lysosome-related organelles complex 1 subunit 2 isoform X3 [Hemicordylus capensis]XP_053163178.1 biogenesis of lysosome-related organelles complex 1 subunit 2 isoform X3 [Hemicordylus capensis]